MVSSAGGNEAGRLSVRVVPDLDGFTEQLLKGVNQSVREVEKLAKKVTVGVELDGAAKVKADMVKLMAELRKLAGTVKITAELDADADGLGRSVRNATKSAEKGAVVDTEMRLDTAARADLRAAVAKLTKQMSAKVDISVDGDDFRKRADKLIRQAEDQLKVPITVDGLDAAKVRSSMNSLVDDLARLGEEIGVLDERIVREQERLAKAAAKAAAERAKAAEKAAKEQAKAAEKAAAAEAKAAAKAAAEQAKAAAKAAAEQRKQYEDYYKRLASLRGADAKAAQKALAAQYREHQRVLSNMLKDQDDYSKKIAKLLKERTKAISSGGDSSDLTNQIIDLAAYRKAAQETYAKVKADGQELYRALRVAEQNSMKSSVKNVKKASVNWSKLGKTLTGVTKKFNVLDWEVKNLHRAFGNIAPFLLGLGVTFQAVLPAALSLAGGVEDLAKAALLGPAALGSFAASVSTLTVGLSGLGDAFGYVVEGDAEKLDEAMKKLSKNGRATVKAFQKLYPELTRVRKAVQDDLMAGFPEAMERLGAKLLPVVSKGMQKVATSLNGMALQAAKYATSSEALNGTRVIFDQTAKAADVLRGGIQSALSGVTALGVAGSKYLPRLSKYIVKLTKDFDKWAKKLVKSGDFDKWVEESLVAWKQLRAAMESVAGILQGLITAAQKAGGLTLGGLAASLERVNKAVNSKGAQAALTAFWSGMNKFASATGGLIVALGPLTGPLLTAVGDAMGAIADAMVAATPAVEDFIKSIGPSFEDGLDVIVDGLKDMAKFAEDNPEAFAAIAAAAVAVLNPMVGVAAAIGAIIVGLGKLKKAAENGAFDKLKGKFDDATAALGRMKTAFAGTKISTDGLGYTFSELADRMGPSLAASFSTIATAVISLGTSVGQTLATWASWFNQIGGVQLLTGVIDGLVKALAGLVQAAMGSMGIFIALLRGDFAAAWDSGVDMVTGAMTAIAGVIQAGAQIIGIDLQDWADDAVAYFKDLSPKMKQAGRDMVDKLLNGLKEMWESVKAWVSQATQDFIDYFDIDLSSQGKDAVDGFIQGLLGGAGAVKAAATSLAASVPSSAEAQLVIASPSRVMRKIGEYTGQGFYLGIQSTAEKTVSVVKSLISKILDAVDSDKLKKSTASATVTYLKNERKQLVKLANQREKVADQLEAAQDKLDTVLTSYRNLRDQTKSSIISAYGVSNADATTVTEYVTYLKNAVTEQEKYNKLVARLEKLGLNSTGIQQLIAQGADDGMALAESLAAGGKAAVAQVNKLQGQLNAAAKTAGVAAAEDMYGAGVDAAQGIVDGLKSKQRALNNAAKAMAKAMVKQIKKSLGIHSPSRVTRREVGHNMGDGVALGIEDKAKSIGVAMRKVRAQATAGVSAASSSSVQAGDGAVVSIGTMNSTDPEVTAAKIAARVRAANARYNLAGVR